MWFQDPGYLTECSEARKKQTPMNNVQHTLKQEVQQQNCSSQYCSHIFAECFNESFNHVLALYFFPSGFNLIAMSILC